MLRKILSLAPALAVGVALSAAAGPLPQIEDRIRPGDVERLSQREAVVGRSLLGAFAEGTPEDVQIVVEGLSGAPLPAAEAAEVIAGDWSCRVVKLGGILPLTAYAPFRCRIGADGSFEKLTGSQRMIGQIGLRGEQMVYAGTGFIAGDTPPPYAELPADTDVTANPQRVPEVGVVEFTSGSKGRMILPLPYLESELNLLLLSR
jgi:hypothetical protein